MTDFRHLYDSFKPKKYQLHLDIDEKYLKFSGEVEIFGDLHSDKNEITLHAHDLEIINATINGNVAKVSKSTENQTLTLESSQKLQKETEIKISFTGNISNSMVGIYPSRFKIDGKEEVIIGTQLESHHARELFPCVDEPAAKAVFSLKLTTRESAVVLANTSEVDKSISGERKTTTFAETPIMSTYLLAFVTGNIASLESKTKTGVAVRTWATPDKVDDTKLALETAVKSLQLLEDFFDIKYPLEKCDLVALPDFSAGAMENWGLCTFRETALLFDENKSTLNSKKYVVAVVAHELAHQWFGNLVTMQWWTDLWLNEGFARWMETYIPDKLYPEWNLWEDFVAGDYAAAQNLDMLDNSHPVEVEIDDPENIRSIFDAISYDKGASLILMLYRFMGEDNFKAGLRLYMNRFAYKNAKTSDLWAAMEEASGLEIKDFMHNWTSQMGFPIVSVAKQNESYVLTQSKYSLKEANDSVWPVPLNSIDKIIFNEIKTEYPSTSLTLPINAQQGGFYVTNYSDDLFTNLASDLSSLKTTEKIGLIHDIYMLNKNGQSGIDKFINLAPAYKDETAFAIWEELASSLVNIRFMHSADNQLVKKIDTFIQKIIIKQYERLGWEESPKDSDNDKALRPIILSLACNSNHTAALEATNKIFDSLEDLTDLNADLRRTVLTTASRTGDMNTYKKMYAFYEKYQTPHMRSALIDALCASCETEAIENNLNMILSKEVKLQDTIYWLAGLLRNSVARERAWQWMQSNWDNLRSAYGTDVMMSAQLPSLLGVFLNTEQLLDEFIKFSKTANTKYIDKKVMQAEEKITHRVSWIKRNKSSLSELL